MVITSELRQKLIIKLLQLDFLVAYVYAGRNQDQLTLKPTPLHEYPLMSLFVSNHSLLSEIDMMATTSQTRSLGVGEVLSQWFICSVCTFHSLYHCVPGTIVKSTIIGDR